MHLITYAKDLKAYRKQTTYSSDAGWGCMIRSVQMALIHALDLAHKQLSLAEPLHHYFLDNQPSVFGFQDLAADIYGEGGKKATEWCTASQVIYSARQINTIQGLSILSVVDSCLVLTRLTDKPANLVVLHLRLGLDSLQEEYLVLLRALIGFKYFTGLLGGRHKHAYYMFPSRDSDQSLYYLDPHLVSDPLTKQRPPVRIQGDFQRIKLQSLNPSMSPVFFYRAQQKLSFFNGLQELTAGMELPFVILEQQMQINEGDFIIIGDDQF